MSTTAAYAEYCADPDHNKVTVWRERRRLAGLERGVTTTEARQPVTMAWVTGAEMLRQMRDLAGHLADVADRHRRGIRRPRPPPRPGWSRPGPPPGSARPPRRPCGPTPSAGRRSPARCGPRPMR